MLLSTAIEIVGARLGKESKMPPGVYSWGFGRENCNRGQELAKLVGTMCASCYGIGGNFRFPDVKAAQRRRLEAWRRDPAEWVRAMAFLITLHCPSHFRWLSTGDLQGVAMLESFAEVCRRTPHITHWLPTHEPYVVRDFGLHRIPPNLVVRISADYIEDRPTTDTFGLLTHTCHRWPCEPVPAATGKRRDSLECTAYRRGNNCGRCRACWDKRIPNTSFLFHGPSAPKHDFTHKKGKTA